MGKTALCIRMLEILYGRDVVSIAELSSILETNPRNIPEYKKELEQCGYVIETVAGRHGGYRLKKNELFPAVGLDAEEKEGLLQGFAYLRTRRDFMYEKAFSSAMGKIASAAIHDGTEADLTASEHFPLSMTRAELEERYRILDQGIRGCLAVEMTYADLEGSVTVRRMHPYKLFAHHDSWYVLGFDELDRDIRYFRLNRIREIKRLDRKFRVMYTYREQDYIDEFGMKRHGEWHAVRLLLSGPYAAFARERTYGKHQTVKEIDGKTVLLQCEMQNKDRILQFVLGCGTHCRVLEPAWLCDAVRNAANGILEQYKSPTPQGVGPHKTF